MNVNLSEGRVHGWGKVDSTRNSTYFDGPGHGWGKVDFRSNGESSHTPKKSVGWCTPSVSKFIVNGHNVNKAKDVRGNIDNQFQLKKPYLVMTNTFDECRVQSGLKTAREVSNVHCVHGDINRNRRVVKLVSDGHFV